MFIELIFLRFLDNKIKFKFKKKILMNIFFKKILKI